MCSKYSNVTQDACAIDMDERTDRETNGDDNTISDYSVVHIPRTTEDERTKLVDHEQDNSAQNESQSKPLTPDNTNEQMSNIGFSETNISANLNNSSNHSKKVTPSEHSNYSSTSSVERDIKPKKRTLCVFVCCVSGTSSIIVAIVTTMLVLVFTGPHSPLIKVQSGNTSTASSRSEKLTGNGATFSCAQLYLDMDRFKEDKTMRWVYGDGACSSYSRDVTTDDNTPIITIQHDGLYSIRSKITFNLGKSEIRNTIFHSVVLNRKGSRRMLEKNTNTLVDSSVRPDSFKMPSSISVLATLRAGDQINIGVLDEALVFPSRTDNTLQLIRYM